MSLVRLPRGASAVQNSPSPLASPADGTPAPQDIDLSRFWRVPMSFGSASAWFLAHAPAGHLQRTGTSGGGGPGYQTSGVDYSDASAAAWQSAELEIGVTGETADASYVRADAVVVWLDPLPVRDIPTGRRIHFSVLAGCPSNDSGLPDVANSTSGLSAALLPDAAPTQALLCRYGGLNNHSTQLIGHRELDATAAQEYAVNVQRVPLAHPVGTAPGIGRCPMDDGSTGYVAFGYSDGTSVDLKITLNGCTTVDNGAIVASAGSVTYIFNGLGH
jgi:hypothetical protein